MYNEEFPISKNSITSGRIDEDYGLTDVMPGCRIRLSSLNPTQRTLYENEPGRGQRSASQSKQTPRYVTFAAMACCDRLNADTSLMS